MYSDQKPKDSDRKSEEITQGSGLRKATPSDQKPKDSDRTKSKSPIYNKVIYNKGTMYSDQKPKVSDRKSEEITQGSGLRKATPSDQKPKVSDRTKSKSPIYNKVIYNKEAMYSDQKPKVSDRTKSKSPIYNKVIYNKEAMYSDQKPKVSDRTKSKSNGYNKNLYNKEVMYSNKKIKDLREIAKSRGLKGWSGLRKYDLINFIERKEEERKAEEKQRLEAEKSENQRQRDLTKLRDERKAKSKARRQAKREESKREAERRAEVKRIESNQRKQRQENITGERPSGKETKSQRKQRQRLEKQAKQAESQRRAHEQAQKKNPRRTRKEKKRRHRATKKEAKRRLSQLQQRRLVEPARPEPVSNAIEGNVRRWFVSGEGYVIPKDFLNSVGGGVKKVVDEIKGPKKTYAVLKCTLVKHDLKTGDRIFSDFNGHSGTHTVTAELGETYEEMKEKMLESLAKYQKEGSGWQLYSIKGLDVSVVKFNPLDGSGYSKLPPLISNKNSIVNMKNDDDQCFKWAVTRALNPVDNHPERITKELKKQAEEINWEGITFPTKVKDISIWEKSNDKFVNVFGYDEDKKIYPIKLCDNHTNIVLSDEETQDKKFINLFLHDDNHYCVVKNLSRLVSSQINNRQHKKHFCLNCMNGFSASEILTAHQKACLKRKPQTEVFPKPGDTVQFRNYERLHDVPFVVYADFECFVKPQETEEKDSSESYTVKYQSHVPSGFCYTIKCMDETVYPTKTVLKTASYEGEDMGKSFVETLSEDFKPIYKILKNPKPMVMSDSEKSQYEKTKNCYVCKTQFGTERLNERTKKKEKVVKCKDHCHVTGKYRGAACGKCNLRMRVPMFVPVLFHNLEGYDANLFVKSLGIEEGIINCIPKTDEKYISFNKKIPMETIMTKDGKDKVMSLEMRFLDSFKFTLKSLDSLVKTLGEDKFETLTSQMIPQIPKETESGRKHDRLESLKLLKQKGVFPYEYMTNFSKLSETSLPPKEAFYSQLNDTGITDEDYERAKKVWKTFNCKTMRDYHDLYLKTDVLLLADVMTEFRKTCKKAYGLEAFHYYTSPGLALDAMLKYTEAKLDLISDPDMYLMIERGIRGGVSSIMKRHSEANHKYLDNYDPKKPDKYILYLDANNLYGWAMSKPQPNKNFRWMKENELKNWKSMPCFLEVDLEYPEELHDLHNEYPLAPEKITVGKVEKLVPNLNDKKNYVLHCENLKLYMRKGLKLTKIHRGVIFEESAFMKPYIDLNTDMRTKGTTDFEKDFYKLMNNSVFGKTMENVRNRVNVKLVTNKKALNKLVKKANYKRISEFDENLVAVHMEKTTVKLNKPIYLGMTILDLSKTLMYEFHYDYVKPKWGDKAKLLFTDTDSLCYEIETDDVYKDIKNDADKWYDTSNYDKDHPSGLYSGKNKKIIGYMKDECGGKYITEFVGLRAKSYSFITSDGKVEKKCKGVKKYVVKKYITHEDYKECLSTKISQLRTMNTIRSRKHEIGSERINKTALSANDDKRIILEDGIHTLAYGYKGTKYALP